MAALIQEQNLNIILFPYIALVGLDRLPLFVKLARVISSPFINQVYNKDICSNAGCLTPHSANHFFLFMISSNFSLRLRMDVHASM